MKKEKEEGATTAEKKKVGVITVSDVKETELERMEKIGVRFCVFNGAETRQIHWNYSYPLMPIDQIKLVEIERDESDCHIFPLMSDEFWRFTTINETPEEWGNHPQPPRYCAFLAGCVAVTKELSRQEAYDLAEKLTETVNELENGCTYRILIDGETVTGYMGGKEVTEWLRKELHKYDYDKIELKNYAGREYDSLPVYYEEGDNHFTTPLIDLEEILGE